MIFSLLAGIAGGSSGLVLASLPSILLKWQPSVPAEQIMRYSIGKNDL